MLHFSNQTAECEGEAKIAPRQKTLLSKSPHLVEKSFWTPFAFVSYCVVLRNSLKSPSAVSFSAVTNINQHAPSQHIQGTRVYFDNNWD